MKGRIASLEIKKLRKTNTTIAAKNKPKAKKTFIFKGLYKFFFFILFICFNLNKLKCRGNAVCEYAHTSLIAFGAFFIHSVRFILFLTGLPE